MYSHIPYPYPFLKSNRLKAYTIINLSKKFGGFFIFKPLINISSICVI